MSALFRRLADFTVIRPDLTACIATASMALVLTAVAQLRAAAYFACVPIGLVAYRAMLFTVGRVAAIRRRCRDERRLFWFRAAARGIVAASTAASTFVLALVFSVVAFALLAQLLGPDRHGHMYLVMALVVFVGLPVALCTAVLAARRSLRARVLVSSGVSERRHEAAGVFCFVSVGSIALLLARRIAGAESIEALILIIIAAAAFTTGRLAAAATRWRVVTGAVQVLLVAVWQPWGTAAAVLIVRAVIQSLTPQATPGERADSRRFI